MKNKRYFIHLALLNAKGGILVNRGGLCECGLRSLVLGSLFRTLLVVVCHCNVRDFNSIELSDLRDARFAMPTNAGPPAKPSPPPPKAAIPAEAIRGIRDLIQAYKDLEKPTDEPDETGESDDENKDGD